MSLTIGIGLVVLLTIGAALRVRGRKMSAPLGMIVCGVLAIGFLAGAAAYSAIQDQRVHDQCLYNVARSDGNRQMWLDIGMFMKDHNVSEDALNFVAEHLDANLPQRTASDCST